jgi:hypothetical protein
MVGEGDGMTASPRYALKQTQQILQINSNSKKSLFNPVMVHNVQLVLPAGSEGPQTH